MIISFAGKGGTGKTSLAALLLDELARAGYPGPVLAVDGDPATTLPLALGLPEPLATVADIRELTPLNGGVIRDLPDGVTTTAHVLKQLQQSGVVTRHELRGMPLHLMAMGQGEGPGCYCHINQLLAQILNGLIGHYSLVVIDNEAGVEHLSRYRLKQVDLFLVVANPTPAARAVAQRIGRTAQQVGIEIGQVGTILNRATSRMSTEVVVKGLEAELKVAAPNSWSIYLLAQNGQPAVALADNDPARQALKPLVAKVLECA
jgi:CO dehydrogenase maturation factor